MDHSFTKTYPKKIYSIHEPEAQFISMGKEYKKYEFGNKVSIIRSATGIILRGYLFVMNTIDIQTSLAQVERLLQRKIKVLAGDRGHRGKKEVRGIQILLSNQIADIRGARNINYSASEQA